MQLICLLVVYLMSLAAALPTIDSLLARGDRILDGLKECPSNHGYGPQWPTLNQYYSAVDTACQLMIPTNDRNHPVKPPFTAKVELKLTTDGATGKPFKKKMLLNTTFRIQGYGPLTQSSCKTSFGVGGNPSRPPWEQTMIDNGAFCARPTDKAVRLTGYLKTANWWNTVEMIFDKPRFEHI
ncbi:hypothetical protein NX059_011707 [Plenodomus lindquistii]|nr:hypothetical protein NX059_011707 [Plenodomus lindquistii]